MTGLAGSISRFTFPHAGPHAGPDARLERGTETVTRWFRQLPLAACPRSQSA
ncbi:MAG: hypothetical protein ABIR11_09655 [Candidatus Limnocylindrales bacterium]